MIGTIIDGRYRIDALLGEGGMGSVYRAYHVNFEKNVAIKFVHPTAINSETLQRFQREASMLERLSHPNIVKFLAFGATDGIPFAVIEYLEGESLADLLAKNGPIPVAECLRIFDQILQALTAAHEQGIVHRDLKPSNILLCAGNVKVLDFGLAKLIDGDGAAAQKVTKTGALVGTPQYMSPEHCAGRQVNATTDIYSIGCVLFECISGQPPFQADSAYGLLMQHMTEEPPRVLPSSIENIVLKAMEKNPEDRYSSAEEFREALASANGAPHAVSPPTPRKRRNVPSAAAPAQFKAMALAAVFAIACAAFLHLNQNLKTTNKSLASDAPVKLAKEAKEACELGNAGRARFLIEKALEASGPTPSLEFVHELASCADIVRTKLNSDVLHNWRLNERSTLPAGFIADGQWILDAFGRLETQQPAVKHKQIQALAELAILNTRNEETFKGSRVWGSSATAREYFTLADNEAIRWRQTYAPVYGELLCAGRAIAQRFITEASAPNRTKQEVHDYLQIARELLQKTLDGCERCNAKSRSDLKGLQMAAKEDLRTVELALRNGAN